MNKRMADLHRQSPSDNKPVPGAVSARRAAPKGPGLSFKWMLSILLVGFFLAYKFVGDIVLEPRYQLSHVLGRFQGEAGATEAALEAPVEVKKQNDIAVNQGRVTVSTARDTATIDVAKGEILARDAATVDVAKTQTLGVIDANIKRIMECRSGQYSTQLSLWQACKRDPTRPGGECMGMMDSVTPAALDETCGALPEEIMKPAMPGAPLSLAGDASRQ